MTITATANSATFQGNGSETNFAFTFVGVAAADLSVSYIDTSGNESVLSPATYTISLNAAATGALWGVGGTVTYPISGSPIASGTQLIVTRSVPYTQTTSIQNQGAFYAQAVEQALDLLCMEIQQLANQLVLVPTFHTSAGSPLNVVPGNKGDFCTDTTNNHLYWKQTGSNNATGWVQVSGT